MIFSLKKYKEKKQIKKYLVLIAIFFAFAVGLFLVVQSDNQVFAQVNEKEYKVDFNGDIFHFKEMFFGIIKLEAWIIAMFVSLIGWSLSPEFMDIIRDNEGLYEGWALVRDFLNILFIFFLLFSAFSTIFQVQKYHIKNTWIMIVVMALLVNFSWPFARILIDISNVTMDFILTGPSGGADSITGENSNSILAKMGSESDFAAILIGKTGFDIEGEVSYSTIFLGIIAGLAFLITIGAIAFIFVIRVIVLAVLLVFASAGFVLAAFPTTRSFASQWWDAFTKQLLIGPILLFALILSVNVMETTTAAFTQGAKDSVASNGASAVLANFAVVLILIWTAMMAASRIGAAGAGFVTSKANGVAMGIGNFSKRATMKTAGFVGRKTAKATIAGADALSGVRVSRNGVRTDGTRASDVIAQTHGIATGWKQRFKNADDKRKERYNDRKEEYAARTEALGAGKGVMDGYGANVNALTEMNAKKVAKLEKEFKDNDTPTTALINKLTQGNNSETELQAIVNTLNKRDDVDTEGFKQLISVMDSLDKTTQKAINKKVSESGEAHLLVEQGNKNPREVYGGMDATTLAKQKVITEFANNPTQQNRDMFNVVQERFNSFSEKKQQDFMDSMSLEQRREYARARARNRVDNGV